MFVSPLETRECKSSETGGKGVRHGYSGTAGVWTGRAEGETPERRVFGPMGIFGFVTVVSWKIDLVGQDSMADHDRYGATGTRDPIGVAGQGPH